MRNYTQTPSRAAKRAISRSQTPLPTQQTQATKIHAPNGIRTLNPSRRAASDPRLSTATGKDRLSFKWGISWLSELINDFWRMCQLLCSNVTWLFSTVQTTYLDVVYISIITYKKWGGGPWIGAIMPQYRVLLSSDTFLFRPASCGLGILGYRNWRCGGQGCVCISTQLVQPLLCGEKRFSHHLRPVHLQSPGHVSLHRPMCAGAWNMQTEFHWYSVEVYTMTNQKISSALHRDSNKRNITNGWILEQEFSHINMFFW
jgi:hypothetical protein